MFERSEDHHILHGLLSHAGPGDIVTYADMTNAVGKQVTGTFSPLRSVLNRFLNEDGIVFKNVKKVGYRRLTADQTVENADEDRAHLHRHARRTGKRLSTVDADFVRLDERHRVAYCVGISLFQAILAATTKNAAKLLEARVRRTDQRPLPFHETLEAFASK